jgi:DNA-binding transcriptional regulator YiaG
MNYETVKNHQCLMCFSKNVEITLVKSKIPERETVAEIEFDRPMIKCHDCNEISESVESANMVINAEIESQKILTANEIKQIRKNLPNKYNQTEFAKLIGASVPSVARWESRGKSHLKPNESNTIILKLLRDVPEIYWKLLYYKMKEI